MSAVPRSRDPSRATTHDIQVVTPYRLDPADLAQLLPYDNPNQLAAGPYFHDGSATDLTQVVTRMLPGTNQPPLSGADSADLVAYLETL